MSFIRIFKRDKDPRSRELKKWMGSKFNLRPKDISLYIMALRHKSAARNIHNEPHTSNERLEFLGDAILDASVADYLFSKFPHAEEGDLTKIKSRIVSRTNLNLIAVKMEIDQLLETDLQATNSRESIAGNALEAIFGAMYLDSGYQITHSRILRILDQYADLEHLEYKEADFKSRLYEEAHKIKADLKFVTRPKNKDKINHTFVSEALMDSRSLGSGEGPSKKKAEQSAAREALRKLNLLDE